MMQTAPQLLISGILLGGVCALGAPGPDFLFGVAGVVTSKSSSR